MLRRASASSTAAVLLMLGIAIGSGLIFGTLYASGSLGQRTEIQTTTQFVTTTLTLTTTPTSGVIVSSAQVSAQVTRCAAGAGTVAHNNECTVVLTNTGTIDVAVTGGSVQINGVSMACNPAPSGTVYASSSLTVTCLQRAATFGQTIGSQAVGQFSLSNGASAVFSGTWS